MFERVVAGVDPGTAAVGVAIVTAQGGRGGRPSLVWSGTIRTAAGLPAAERLHLIHRALGEVLDQHAPASLGIERLMWNRNAHSAMDVARASGVVLLAAAERSITVEEYGPLEVKMAVTGVGNAAKDAVRRGLQRVLGMDVIPGGPDAADAVAVAVCHLQQSRLRQLSRGAAR